MTLLSINGLFSRYSSSNGPVYAVDDVDFELDSGESLGIAGESACGKSTLGLSLIRMLSGGTSFGKILFDGDSILDLPESKFDDEIRWKKISMIFQGAMNSLDPVFTIKQQFVEILKQHNFDGNFDESILDSINSVNLDDDILKKYPHELDWKLTRVMINLIGLKKGETLCDPFCGTGTTLLESESMGINAIGIDFDENMCEISKENLEINNYKSKILKSDFQKLVKIAKTSVLDYTFFHMIHLYQLNQRLM